MSLSLLLPSSLGSVICEDLPLDLCAFSISSTGKRCLLESFPNMGLEYQCTMADVKVERISDWIETDDCVKACGVDRSAVGISSDEFLQPRFTAKLCSSACYQSCPNIVDLYSNLAAAEGVYLPDLCEARQLNTRRSMVELSSGVASGPAASGLAAVAPSTA
ncbi:hypothetical protein IEQ34_002186 [Dendrobium chrysotoxum]|uniref:PAR1 protein n=1 Tax=Dendrobium chrysotoxum TaxID=161865 RepID=A0AAV7HL66_DENCH|nr:hypothetical protein IEQ34_002186 [Dendrobium chrysotoxum]